MADEKYLHGAAATETVTDVEDAQEASFGQAVIGTAPVHWLSDYSGAINTPIKCESLADCSAKLGYSTDFEKYTLCQAMYTSFVSGAGGSTVKPVVFINVLDPEKHKKAVEETEYPINSGAVTIADDVIVSSLVVKFDGAELIAGTDYVTEWNGGELIITFTENKEGTAAVSYDAADPSLVTAADIIGAYDSETEKRTGAELIKEIYPKLGVIPMLLLAPGWSENDTVGAALMMKAEEINGCYGAMALLDLDSEKSRTRAAAIEEKKNRTCDANCIMLYPKIKKGDYIISYSAYMAAQIMAQSLKTGGITCKSPSNKAIAAVGAVLSDGTPVYYDTEDGNELNAYGIVTIINRNGLYTWGNNTAAYPDATDPIKRWIMTRLAFRWIENDYIAYVTPYIDEDLNRSRLLASATDDYNIRLASYKAAGYIIDGRVTFNAADNPASKIVKGQVKVRTPLAANIPGEYIENEFSFDTDTLYNNITGGEA